MYENAGLYRFFDWEQIQKIQGDLRQMWPLGRPEYIYIDPRERTTAWWNHRKTKMKTKNGKMHNKTIFWFLSTP